MSGSALQELEGVPLLVDSHVRGRREKRRGTPSQEVSWLLVLTGTDVGQPRDRRSGDSGPDGIEAKVAGFAEQEERCAVLEEQSPRLGLRTASPS